nr:MAG TPA: hypothetical protein [Caudoviricetes sp.]
MLKASVGLMPMVVSFVQMNPTQGKLSVYSPSL